MGQAFIGRVPTIRVNLPVSEASFVINDLSFIANNLVQKYRQTDVASIIFNFQLKCSFEKLVQFHFVHRAI